jgi:hypothetical protein
VSVAAKKEEDVEMPDLDEAALKAKDGWKSLLVIEVSFGFYATSSYLSLVLTIT